MAKRFSKNTVAHVKQLTLNLNWLKRDLDHHARLLDTQANEHHRLLDAERAKCSRLEAQLEHVRDVVGENFMALKPNVWELNRDGPTSTGEAVMSIIQVPVLHVSKGLHHMNKQVHVIAQYKDQSVGYAISQESVRDTPIHHLHRQMADVLVEALLPKIRPEAIFMERGDVRMGALDRDIG